MGTCRYVSYMPLQRKGDAALSRFGTDSLPTSKDALNSAVKISLSVCAVLAVPNTEVASDLRSSIMCGSMDSSDNATASRRNRLRTGTTARLSPCGTHDRSLSPVKRGAYQ